MQFEQINFSIWTNTFFNLDKHIHSTWYSHRHGHPVTRGGGQIYFGIWANTLCNLDHYIFQFGQIHFTAPSILTGTNTRSLGRVGTQEGGQIYFGIWINTLCNLDKYTLQVGQSYPINPHWPHTSPVPHTTSQRFPHSHHCDRQYENTHCRKQNKKHLKMYSG